MQEGYFPFPLYVADVVLPNVFCSSPSFKGILDGTRMWEIYVVRSIKLFCDSSCILWFTLRKEFSAQVYTSCTERFSSNIDGSDFLTFTSFIHLEFISRYVNWRWKFFHMHTVF